MDTVKLEFVDHWGLSLRAKTPGGAYYVLLVRGGWRPQLSDGAVWVWTGAPEETPEAAMAACQRHADASLTT